MQFHNIDGVDIPFEEDWTKVAVSVSGGADSALLAFLVCLSVPNIREFHCISHTRMWKTRPWQGWDSDQVFDWLKNYFPLIEFYRHKSFIAPELEYGIVGPTMLDEYGKFVSGDNVQQRAYAEYVCKTYNIDAYYNAVSHNPRSVDLGGMLERDVEPTEDNRHLVIMKHMDVWALHPFRFIEKKWIVKQYIDNNIMDLFNLTRSCEGDIPGINFETYKKGQQVPVCGKCFWCKEREWAIEQNK